MKKVFAKVGMHMIHTMHLLKFSELQKLPGWTAANHNEDKDDDDGDDDCKVQPQSLMEALGLEKYISAKAKEQKWIPVQSAEELEQTLVTVKQHEGMGYLPGLYNYSRRGINPKESR